MNVKQYKTFTPAQMRVLKQWEPQFNSVVNSGYLRGVGKTSLTTIAEIYKAATGIQLRVVPGCSECVFDTLKCVGKAYFDEQKWQAQRSRKVTPEKVEDNRPEEEASNAEAD